MSTDIVNNQFFQSFSPAGRDRLISRAKFTTYNEGEYLFYEGDPADGICLVLIGEVAITRVSEGHEMILTKFVPGDYFGEVAVLDGFGRSTNARAHTSVRIAKLPRDEVLQVLNTEEVYLTISLFQKVLNQLRTTNNLLLQAMVQKEKMQLVGEMANLLIHDFRNPIASMRLAADNLSLTHKDEKSQKWCHIIRSQSERVMGMTRELLEFSRGETSLEFAPANLQEVLQLSTSLLADYMQESKVTFYMEAKPVNIQVDVMRLLRVLQNLISNAVEALQNQEERVIEVIGWEQDDITYISVQDNGPGIPEQIRSTLFQPFVSSGKKNGTGLGMAIAKNIITAHGGTIDFETETGKGTRFVIALPQNRTT